MFSKTNTKYLNTIVRRYCDILHKLHRIKVLHEKLSRRCFLQIVLKLYTLTPKWRRFLCKSLYLGAAVNLLHITIVIRDIIGYCVIKILRNSISLRLRFQSLAYLKRNMQIDDGILPALLISGGPMERWRSVVPALITQLGTGSISLSHLVYT